MCADSKVNNVVFVAYYSDLVPAVPLVPGTGEVVKATILCVEHVCACIHVCVHACSLVCSVCVVTAEINAHSKREQCVPSSDTLISFGGYNPCPRF